MTYPPVIKHGNGQSAIYVYIIHMISQLAMFNYKSQERNSLKCIVILL